MSQTHAGDQSTDQRNGVAVPTGPTGGRRRLGVAFALLLLAVTVGAVILLVILSSDARSLREEVAALTDENSVLRDELETVGDERETAQAALSQTNAALASCQEAISSAREFSGLFEELSVVDELWWETEEGSAEEAELDAASLEIEDAMLLALGRFESQADACLPPGQAG